ncbi:MAG: hypothetical protein WA729_07345, partial [Pseudolabrys sp.]
EPLRSGARMRRREFIVFLSGAATWPFAARAQQPERRRIAVLMSTASGDKRRAGGSFTGNP